MRLNPQTNSCFDASDHIRHKPEAHDTPDNDASALMSTSPTTTALTNLQEMGEELYYPASLMEVAPLSGSVRLTVL